MLQISSEDERIVRRKVNLVDVLQSDVVVGIDRNHDADRFVREWSSFDRLTKGDVIGIRHDGTEVRAPHDGWILFPDAKAQPGHEWFYLAEDNPGIV